MPARPAHRAGPGRLFPPVPGGGSHRPGCRVDRRSFPVLLCGSALCAAAGAGLTGAGVPASSGRVRRGRSAGRCLPAAGARHHRAGPEGPGVFRDPGLPLPCPGRSPGSRGPVDGLRFPALPASGAVRRPGRGSGLPAPLRSPGGTGGPGTRAAGRRPGRAVRHGTARPRTPGVSRAVCPAALAVAAGVPPGPAPTGRGRFPGRVRARWRAAVGCVRARWRLPRGCAGAGAGVGCLGVGWRRPLSPGCLLRGKGRWRVGRGCCPPVVRGLGGGPVIPPGPRQGRWPRGGGRRRSRGGSPGWSAAGG